MTRPNDEDDALEAMLAAVAPAAPSADLRRQVAAALAAPSGATPSSLRWLGERLLWACGGAAAAVAASLVFAPSLTPREGPPADAGTTAAAATVPASAPAPVAVSEEMVTWADVGVRFLDDRTPARVLRRLAIERHRPAVGPEFRMPREDVILLPVALQ